jgi:PAS domain S-box-containing protein
MDGAAAPAACLAGGGEMGALMRALDWSKTPLGPVEAWTPALRMMVRFLLANRFPLLLWWGPEYIQLYNDAYRPIPGTKHPKSLGQPASACWPEIWHIIGPLVDKPFHGGPATWMEDIELEVNRHGFVEETHFTIAYSPVPDETAPRGIGGVLGTVHEMTEKVVGERRMAVLRDLGAKATPARTAEEACATAAKVFAAHAKDVPFALIYLFGGDGKQARLAGTAGVAGGGDVGPEAIGFQSQAAEPWPWEEVQRTGRAQLVANLPGRFATVPPGPWSDAPHLALLLPLPASKAGELAGFLVAGVSARLKLDDAYRGFLELASGQVATAIANARAYEEEKKRAEKLAELDRAKTDFFANVSHEFRTPLTLMLGPIEDALRDAKERRERDRLEMIQRGGLRLQKLVNTLLDFSRIEAGRLRASYELTNLAKLTAELASNFRSACAKAGLAFHVDCPPLSRPVYVDRDMWEKVVLNLLSNAFKFTLEGEIEVAVAENDAMAMLRVRDTGSGIADQQLPHIFERFHRVEGVRARSNEGTGIGLAFVQELVKLHGGAITVTSALDKGTTFTVAIPFGSAHLPAERVGTARAAVTPALGTNAFVAEALEWLPRTPEHSPLTCSPRTDAEVITDVKRVARPHVLVVDDNADMRKYLCALLSKDYEVEAVADGEAALAAVGARRPDGVVTDVMLPKRDGFGLLRELRADSRTRVVPVIMLSARAGEEGRVEGLQAGADDYLVKPFHAQELLARVSAHLRLAEARREARESFQALKEAQRLAHIGSWQWDAQTDRNVVSDELCHIYGLPVGQPIPDFKDQDGRMYPHESWVRLNDAVEESLRTGIGYELDLPALRHGEPIWITTRGEAIRDTSGRIVGLRGTVQDITDRKQAEEKLRRAEERAAADLEAMTLLQEVGAACARADVTEQACLERILDAAITLLGADKGNIQRWDAAAGTLRIVAQRGFEREFLDFFAEVNGEAAAACGAAMRAGQRRIIPDVTRSELFALQPALRVLLNAGVRAVQSTPLIAATGRVLGMISTHFAQPHAPTERDLRFLDLLARQTADFLERRQTEVEVRRQAELLRAINDSTSELIFMKDRDGRLIYANAATLRAVGMTADKALGTRDRDNFRELAEHEPISTNDRRVLETGATLVVEEPYTCADGKRRVFVSTKNPLRDAAGRIIGVIGVSRDVTEGKQAEQALREREEQFRTLADNMAQFAWTCDELGLATWYNQRWYDYTGTTLATMKGDGWKAVHHPDHLEHVSASLQKSITTGEPWEDTFPLRGRDGSYRWFLSRAVPIRDETGRIHRWFGTNTDITQQRELEEALKEADRRKDEFLATLAHELRNPLAPIRNSLHLLRLAGTDSGAAERVHDMMERQVNHMVRLVDDLMEVSRITRGKIELRKEQVELAAIVRSAVETSKPLLEASRHHLGLNPIASFVPRVRPGLGAGHCTIRSYTLPTAGSTRSSSSCKRE